MIRFYFSILLLLCSIGMTIQINAQQTPRTTTSGAGYLEYLPADYLTNPTKKYPLLIFLHGAGETGNGSALELEKVKTNGPSKLIQSGHNMCFTVNGVQECFIVISPQLTPNAGGWWPSILQPIFDYVLNGSQNYRIDKTRVYLTGLSLGGQGVYIGLGETTDIFAAGAVIAGFNNGNGCTISARKIPVWGFHGESDGTIPYGTGLNEFSKIGWCTTPTTMAELKWTNYPEVGHNSWDNAYTTDHSVQSPLNLYEWLLTKNKNLSGNALPTANAGNDQTITLPTNSLSLTGSGMDSDGTISSYLWTQVSGSATSMINPNTSTLSLAGLAASGTYTFRLTVTDNLGATASDDITITVNIAPMADAGTDQTITLPSNSLVITGNGMDLDGSISSYNWTKVSSLPATLTNTNTNTLNLAGLASGAHVVRLTVTDDLGATASDEVNVIVNPSANLAIGKIAVTSSNENASLAGAKAVDGSTTTRWSSQFSDPQWIYIDLGSNVNINQVKITWEAAAASNYKIQTSSDAITWADIKTISGNTTLVNDHTGLIGGGRYVRVYGTTRKTTYGYSIYELEVYGNVGNVLPIANAGADQTITLPTNSLNLIGGGTDSDGTISSYAWAQVSGPAITLTNPNTNTLNLTGLASGSYVFRLTVTDNSGATASDDINVTVNIPPIANAGADQTITLPINSLNITGSGTDSDGTISSYLWTKVSGATATLANASTGVLGLSGLISGTYVFRLIVTDNAGATASDDVTVTVNTPPIANAGADQTITLPINSLNIAGSGTDSDGTISSYLWTKVSGLAATLTNQNTNTLSLTALVSGTFVFRLTITDNSGVTASDDVNVVVNPAPNVNPVTNAGADQTITLPTNSLNLVGSGTDSDGTISSYTWIKVSGSSAALSNSNTNTLNLSGLVSGTYVFRLTVTDNSGATASDDVILIVNPAPAQSNLALGKPVFTSSNEGWSFTGTQAVDGNSTTRWSSLFSDFQWIYVDLGSSVNINRVKIIWEAASASDYRIQTSHDAVAWTDLKSISGNTTLINDHTGLNGAGRYVRMLGVTRRTTYGYSVYEFEVYGGIGNAVPVANAGVDQTITLPINSLNITGSGTDSDGTISTYAWTQISGVAVTLANANTNVLGLSGLISGNYSFRLTVTDDAGANSFDDVNVVVNPAPSTNLALNKITVTSSNQGSDAIASSPQAVDGNYTTRWSSQFSDPQWIYVDLGSTVNINQVKITWEAARAANYKIQISNDAIAWTDIKTITGNTTLLNDHTDISGNGRYVRMLGLTRGTIYGYSIYELEVYGVPSTPVSARASSTAPETIGTSTIPTATEEVVGLVFLDKTYFGESDYSVAIFNGNGDNIFKGKWNTDFYHPIFSEEGLYFYHVFKNGKRIDGGKVMIVNK
jgi:L-fucose isomerase-like protein